MLQSSHCLYLLWSLCRLCWGRVALIQGYQLTCGPCAQWFVPVSCDGSVAAGTIITLTVTYSSLSDLVLLSVQEVMADQACLGFLDTACMA